MQTPWAMPRMNVSWRAYHKPSRCVFVCVCVGVCVCVCLSLSVSVSVSVCR